ncbi:MAG: isoprenylcysteine carboxylmethyltransferase family protein [Rhodopirellula sp.]|nr:isoprenylcysteine carboxylmethyltransferase family protein [Rhodopirellula sp.]
MKKRWLERLRQQASRVAAVVWFVGAGATTPLLGADSFTGMLLFLLGAVLTVVGATGRTWCLLYIAGRKNQELLTVGPYSLCRHPLYFFSLVGTVGVGLASRTLAIPGVAAVAFFLYYVGVIRFEQNRLREIHGAEFDSYLQRVNALIPGFRTYQSAGQTREIFIKPVVKGLMDNGWFVLAFVGVHLLGELRVQHLFFDWWTLL